MTTTFLLIRHGLHELGGDIIAGRTPGVHLSDAGRTQADGLCARLADVSIDAIYSSPMERTIETAQPLATRRGLTVEHSPELLEIDFGDWTGKSLHELRGSPGWREWNSFRSG